MTDAEIERLAAETAVDLRIILRISGPKPAATFSAARDARLTRLFAALLSARFREVRDPGAGEA